MGAQTKTVQVATYPDGRRVPIVRERLGWKWDRGAWSSHKGSAIEQAVEAGATITREPNPSYRPRLSTYERLMSGVSR